MNDRLDVKFRDVFISWTGADKEIKETIAEALRGADIEPLLSDEKCQGDFVEWSRAAATSGNIFLTVITENPASVENIDDAFAGCTGLTKIEIPDSVTEIGNSTFEGCTSLAEIKIPAYCTAIGDSAFADCSSLTELVIPENVRRIGNNAFAGCTSLTSVTLSANFKNDVKRIFGDIDPSIIKWTY